MPDPDSTLEPPPLPPAARSLLEKITSGESLGASRNIRQINELFETIVVESTAPSSGELIAKLRQTGEYLSATRGRNTPAIGNAIRLLLKGLDVEAAATVDAVHEAFEQRRLQFNQQSLRNRELLAQFGANLLADAGTLLAFDYSSTMMAILDELAERGQTIEVVVPESRVLDGGRPIADEATARGHSVHFIVDMAFAHFLPAVDAVLVGAETIFANGDCWNTVGSYPISVLARRHHVPFYVATEMIKIDPRSFIGVAKEVKPDEYGELFGYPDRFSHPDLMSVVAPEVDNVPHSLITAYITPRGVLLPEHIRSETLRFLESINAPIFPEEGNEQGIGDE